MRRVLVLSTMCSKPYYEKLSSMRTKTVLDTQQKFMTSIVEGLSEQKDIQVDCVSVVPISRSNYSEKYFREFIETVDGVSYKYVGFRNIPIIKNISAARSMKMAVKKYYEEHKSEDIIVLADSLTIEVSEAALWLQKKRINITAIVTDIPLIAETMGSIGGLHRAYSKYYGIKANRLLLKYDKYILLSEYMNEVVNPEKKKPYVVMECIVNENLFDNIEDVKKAEKPVVMYAGKFYRECGVVELAKAAAELKGICDIWLYGGHGDCIDELETLSKTTSNLLIHGIVPLQEILKIEKECTLLINPRIAEEEFSKYSFPSKTAEYMLSGTPVMMYRLPSLPKEYEPYVYLIENGSLADNIRNVIMQSGKQLEEKGMRASRFIQMNKSTEHQAKRILEFVK